MTIIYSPSNVQELLGIDSSTLRKYATLLEGHGYQVKRNKRGHRTYFEKDVITLRKLIEFSKQEGMTMERSAETVMTWVSEEDKTVTFTEEVPLQTTNDGDTEQNTNTNELLDRIEHLEQVNLDLIKHLKEKAVREAQLEEKINLILKYVERMEQLEKERSNMFAEETRKQIAVAEQRKWWKWWK
ncbi:helix-turn-helix domain-containing protein [Bacillus sp. sid0103]|uniref:MerR family transcriptional regulator n=1 Tax=Bacillus sp. sid0103 TaxID=2856337 RepID=UPI001C45824D|nr:MerR family transcriptional regulator [Bacillus sp. sid0103]MBV7508265.1 helix-turn-helix domain-containing protein [Bacillus sp. sid0103]